MFTGIVREVGTVAAQKRQGNGLVLQLHCPASAGEISIGDSVAVNGVCLTATVVDAGGFRADLSSETLQRSSLGTLSNGSAVNIELPLSVSGRIDGHIVQGHVDGLGTIEKIQRSGEGWFLRLGFSSRLEPYIVEKGSIALDGISLTVASVAEGSLEVAVIPHTWRQTHLREATVGQRMNIEVDILAKYVEKMMKRLPQASAITQDFLTRHGFSTEE